jgi:anti-sigma factor (TIGR02949 family)
VTAYDPCAHCEDVMQPYMDRVLTDAERAEAEAHLEECAYCRKRYRFEETLRQYVRQVVAAEPMPVELKKKLSELRTPLQ